MARPPASGLPQGTLMKIALNDRLARLPAAERIEILKQLRNIGHPIEALPVTVGAAPTCTPWVPAAAQRRLLLLETLRPGTLYNRISVTLRLRGSLGVEALEAAFADITKRHEALRTVYRAGPAGTMHAMLVASASRLERVACPTNGDAEHFVRCRRHTLTTGSLDLSDTPPWRAELIRAAADDHWLLMVLHHVVADSWSIDVIARELASAYRAQCKGGRAAWRSPALQARDYALFEAEISASGSLPAEKSHLPAYTAVPADFLRSVEPSREARIVRRYLPADQSIALTTGIHPPLGLSAVLIGATLATLRDLSGSDDVTADVTEAGRWHPASHDLVAALVTTRRLAVRIEAAHSARDIATLSEAAVAKVRHAAVSGDGDPAPCLIVVQNANTEPFALPGITVNRLPLDRTGSHHDIVFVFVPDRSGWTLELEYADDLYDEATANQIADYLLAVLDAMASKPDLPPREVMRLPVATAVALLAPDRDLPAIAPLSPIDRFLAHADAGTDAPALIEPDGRALSYGTLADAALSLADLIGAAIGASPDHGRPIAVLSGHLTVAVLAMLASHVLRKPFVIIDGGGSAERAHDLARQVAAAVVLHDEGHAALAGELRARLGVPTLAVPGLVTATGRPRAIIGEPRPAGNWPAYIAFTSGSTGRRKAVVQSEMAFAQFLEWQEAHFRFAPGFRAAMWSALSFDACYTEVFGALAAGATLCLPAEPERRDPGAIAAWLEHAQISYFLTIPSFLGLVIDVLEAGRRTLPELSEVATSGEVLPPNLVGRLRGVLPNARLHNLFGPTEAILASCHEVPRDHPEQRRLPVGRPLAGRRILILDEGEAPLPAGALGEIAIVSRFLTDGYLGANGVEPFSRFMDDNAERVYRTGDLGRIGADGLLHFCGRRDGQVKIRGMRVDLADATAVLTRRPDVAECALVAQSAGGSSRLVAFVASTRFAPPAGEDYSHARRLPAANWRRAVTDALGLRFAIADFVLVRRLPRTATGKIDFRLLGAFDGQSLPASPDDVHGLSSDNDGLAATIRGAWADVLGRTVNDEEAFFDAGGDSVLAVHLHRRLEAALPGCFGLVDIFANPTVKALVAFAEWADERPLKALAEGAARGRHRADMRRQLQHTTK